MSKKLFYARGQSDAARSKQLRDGIENWPVWAVDAYCDGYNAVLFARANFTIGKYVDGWIAGRQHMLYRNNLPPAKGPDIVRVA